MIGQRFLGDSRKQFGTILFSAPVSGPLEPPSAAASRTTSESAPRSRLFLAAAATILE